MVVLKTVVHVLQILVCNDFGMLNSGTARWKRCRGQSMGKELRMSMYFPGLPFSPNLHVFLKDLHMGFPGGSNGKVSARKAGDPGSIPGSGRSLKKKRAIHSSTHAWKIPWTEEPGGLQSMRLQKSDRTE